MFKNINIIKFLSRLSSYLMFYIHLMCIGTNIGTLEAIIPTLPHGEE